MWKLNHGRLIAPDGRTVLESVSDGVTIESEAADGLFLTCHRDTPAARWEASLGKPAAARFAACFRNEPFWMVPAITSDAAKIPTETQVLFAEFPTTRNTDSLSPIALFVPLIDGHVRCSLQGSPAGELLLVAETGNRGVLAQHAFGLFIAIQSPAEPFEAFLARAARSVAARLGCALREEKSLPAFIDDFGWCTWDAFYQEVSPGKLREGLEAFQAGGLSPKFLILDDGWQSEQDFGEAHGRRLTSLAPNPKFHQTLAPSVQMAREEFAVRHFLVWHAFQGYWAGVAPEKLPQYHAHETPRDYGPGILAHMPEANSKYWGSSAGIIPPGDIAHFFNDYHALLQSQGVDGVKVDNQAALEALTAPGTSRIEMYQAYRRALEASAQIHFRGNLLHCMSCVNDVLYLGKPGDSALTRTSVDFWPTRPATHGRHLWTNALVSLWFGQFVHPDWDMFQSRLPEPHTRWSEFHAAARAISGGTVYVSDKPGQSDFALLRKLVDRDGRVLRCPNPATIARESLFRDVMSEDVPLKICNAIPRAGGAAVGIIGLFNCKFGSELPVEGCISSSDLPQLAGHARFIVYLHKRGEHHILTETQAIPVQLGEAEYEIATILPLVDGAAVVGLLDKLNSAMAIDIVSHTSNSLHLHARDAGRLGLWLDKAAAIRASSSAVAITSIGHWHIVNVPPELHEFRLTWRA